MFLTTYNAMLEGFAEQIDAQLGKRLFTWNEFPGMTRRPRLKFDPITKVNQSQLAALLGPLSQVLDLGDEDQLAIRKQTGFLPETLPEEVETVPEPETPDTDETSGEEDETAATQGDAERTAETVQASLIKWREWARLNDRKAFAELERKA